MRNSSKRQQQDRPFKATSSFLGALAHLNLVLTPHGRLTLLQKRHQTLMYGRHACDIQSTEISLYCTRELSNNKTTDKKQQVSIVTSIDGQLHLNKCQESTSNFHKGKRNYRYQS